MSVDEPGARAVGIQRFDLTDRKALVTGSSRGLGYALARALLEGGAAVASMDETKLRSASRLSGWLPKAGRWGHSEDLAGALLYLASDVSAFVNGQTLYVDGA